MDEGPFPSLRVDLGSLSQSVCGMWFPFPVCVWNGLVTEATVCTHSPCSDVLDRKLQAEKSSEILSSTPNPVIMLSYITNPPGSRDYVKITNSGRVKVVH